MSDSLRCEYAKITNAIKNVQLKIDQYKQSIEKLIENSNNDEEVISHIEEFRKFTENFKNNSDIINKYKQLKMRQKTLMDALILQDYVSSTYTPSPHIIDMHEQNHIPICKIDTCNQAAQTSDPAPISVGRIPSTFEETISILRNKYR